MTMVFEEKNISESVMRMAPPAMLGQFTRTPPIDQVFFCFHRFL